MKKKIFIAFVIVVALSLTSISSVFAETVYKPKQFKVTGTGNYINEATWSASETGGGSGKLRVENYFSGYTLQSMTISDTVYSGTPYYVSMYVSDGNTNQIYYDFKSDKKFLSETSLIKWFPKMYKPNNSAVVLYSDYYSAGVKQGSRVEIYSIFQY